MEVICSIAIENPSLAHGSELSDEQRTGVARIEWLVRRWVYGLVKDGVTKSAEAGIPAPSPIPIDGEVAGQKIAKTIEPVPYTTPYVLGLTIQTQVRWGSRVWTLRKQTLGTIWGRAEGSVTFSGIPHYVYSQESDGLYYPHISRIEGDYGSTLLLKTGGEFLGQDWNYSKTFEPSNSFEITPPGP